MDFLSRIDSYAETDRVAQIYGHDKLTYKELKQKSDALACYFFDQLKENKKPIIIRSSIIFNSIFHFIILFAILIISIVFSSEYTYVYSQF
ncbi:hypothetical protein [Clostridium sp. Marseille-Q2269]|uniref:hypothetical protein n=1 Tax=Clostridium sp. Marseille-Q2269 TaxID=2942205 RepID=UPI00207370BE|nr:hypothetical protein [Clostridium sp. Marseille-Q2269]